MIETQVELARTDAIALGVKPPMRESGKLAGTPGRQEDAHEFLSLLLDTVHEGTSLPGARTRCRHRWILLVAKR